MPGIPMTLSWLEIFELIWFPAFVTEIVLLCVNFVKVLELGSSSDNPSLSLNLLPIIIGLVALLHVVQFSLLIGSDLFRDWLYCFMLSCRIISVLLVTTWRYVRHTVHFLKLSTFLA
ncbi:hypothetical protein C8R45DRAFT_629743 [Mycena sanguinolenta]|nr:hypothetical protein C8R45DRAFT_629743 [Mycena sanguinolenta]